MTTSTTTTTHNDHLTTLTVNTNHDTTTTVPHNDKEGWKRLGRPPTTTGLETRLHLPVCFFFYSFFFFY